MTHFFRILILSCLVWAASLGAARAFELAPDQMLMLQASQKAVEGKFEEAEALYSQALAANPNNLRGYLGRGLVRRELKNTRGVQDDGVRLLDESGKLIFANASNADAYYLRGMAYRLMGDFTKAEQDVRQAIALDPTNKEWLQDLQAILLEKKIQ